MLILDTCIHDKLEAMWKLNTGNVELITLKCLLQDGAGRIQQDNEGGNLTAAVCRKLREYVA